MKNGVVYITLSDDKMHFLYRRDRNVDPLMLSTTVQSDDDIPRMVVQFASDNDIEPDRAVVAMDGRRCMLRNYAMPIQRRRQLDQAVQFEMDDDIPFERDEIISDHFRGGISEGVSYVSAAVVRKDQLADLLTLFETQGVDVESLDVDVAAFARACLTQSTGGSPASGWMSGGNVRFSVTSSRERSGTGHYTLGGIQTGPGLCCEARTSRR